MNTRREELAETVLLILIPYLPEAPLSAFQLGHKLGHKGSRESVRRRGREAFALADELRPNKIGSFEKGYFTLRSAADRHLAQEFKRTHGLSELYTARTRRVDAASASHSAAPTNPSAPVTSTVSIGD